MISIRKSNERGHNQLDWLDTYHTFSFDTYFDPDFMGFGALRVINQDIVQPNHGFGSHPHKNMEIITYIISGELAHKDNMGNHTIIRPGEIQRMSAGTGVEHSEFNPSENHPVHLLQIWIKPHKLNLKPSYEQKIIPDLHNQLVLIGNSEPTEHSVKIHQDVKLYVAHMDTENSIDYLIKASRRVWIQLISGKLKLNRHVLKPGDGAAIRNEKAVKFKSGEENTVFLLFDLP